jgi:hypothetical protein
LEQAPTNYELINLKTADMSAPGKKKCACRLVPVAAASECTADALRTAK